MSDLVDSEAEESLDESLSSEEEEEEEHNEGRSLSGNLADLINDEEEESAASEDEKSESAKSDDEDDGESSLKRKRSKDEELDEEDLDLIQENLGIRLPKKKFHRLKKVKAFDSDEDEEAESAEPIRERQFIEHQLFELGDREEGDEGVATPEPAPPPIDSTYADIDESESEEDEFDNFIVDDEGKPIKHHHQKRKVMVGGHHDSALQEAQDTFGLAFDFDEFEKFGHDDFDEDEEDYEEEDDERVALKKARRKASKKSIYEVFEPSELEKGMLTDKDAEIKTSDIPERFQVRDVPVEQAEEQELEEEAEWIFKYAFLEQPISHQDVDEQGIPSIDTKQTKPHSTISKIQEALNLMRNQLFEVPFIANYRKEYIEPELNTEDLWKIWEFDEKWTQLRTRKQNLHRLFEQMQDYQFSKVESEREQPLSEETRILQPEDIDRLDAVQTIDQLKDVYSHFMLYYGNDIPTMQEEQRKKALEEKSAREGAEAEEKDDLPKVEPPKLKKPRKRDLYTICHEAGLSGLAKKFGLTPDQFGENLRDNYQRHETEQHPMDPGEAAESYLNSLFPTTDQVLEGARHMVAMQIAKDPLVRQCVREVYGERAKITVTPTKKGKKEIDESHPCFPFKYLKNKPVRDLRGDQYLKLSLAEDEGMLTISLSMDFDNRPGYQTYFDEVKQLYHRDEFSLLVQEWNAQRYQALTRAFTKMLYPFFEKELKTKLLLEAKQFVIKCCQKRLRSWIDVAPYQPEQQHEDNSYDEDTIGGDGLRVLACSFLPDPTVPSFFAMLDGGGNVVDHLRLKYLLVRRNSSNTREKEMKVEDMEKLKDFVLKKRPHVIAVASTCREATSVMDDIKMCLSELEQENQMTPIGVELVDCEVARIYQSSPRSENEVREYPPVLRNALSIGRRLQDPLAEFSSLCVEEDEMLCVRFHPLQDQIDKEKLVKSLHTELVTVVNDVGVDPNRLLDHPHTVALLQFVCGLGPRKASALLKSLRQQGSRLENRSQLVTVCNLGPKIFLNCAGFIKIDTAAISDISTNYIEVLDGSRVHPETYEWAKQMAVDALEYDETTEEANPSAALEEILDTPDRLKDLDLDAFAVELERQNYGNKKITLYDIRDELFGRYRERRVPYRSLSIEEVFRLLTGETSNSLYVGKLVICTVTGFAFRKPAREMIDQANPERNDQTGLWQCPFCLKNDYAELGDVWTHLDNGSCPGQAVGVRVRHDSGLSGFIPTKMISDKHVKSPQERVKVGMTLHGRVTRINMERFQIDLTCRSSDLTDKDNKFSLPKDLYYDKESEDKDKKEEELVKKKANRPKYIKRVIVHPAFRNISFKEAEKVLSDMEQGECVVRPSSKGSDHLTVTWKVEQGIYQHIDVREEGKENAFSLGRSLWIENEEFEDLDEIIARHIQPMAALSREVVAHKYHRSAEGGVKQKLEEILIIEKKKAVQRIPYYISLSKAYPGKFLLGYMPRNKPRIEMVSITPDGFRYRNRVHGTLNGLFRWFKEHFRDPIPGYRNTPTAMSESNTPYTPGATPSVHPSSYSQWGNTTSGNSSHIPAQSTLTPTAPAYRSNQPQFGYYQTHQDSMSTAVQNYQRTQQRQGYRT